MLKISKKIYIILIIFFVIFNILLYFLKSNLKFDENKNDFYYFSIDFKNQNGKNIYPTPLIINEIEFKRKSLDFFLSKIYDSPKTVVFNQYDLLKKDKLLSFLEKNLYVKQQSKNKYKVCLNKIISYENINEFILNELFVFLKKYYKELNVKKIIQKIDIIKGEIKKYKGEILKNNEIINEIQDLNVKKNAIEFMISQNTIEINFLKKKIKRNNNIIEENLNNLYKNEYITKNMDVYTKLFPKLSDLILKNFNLIENYNVKKKIYKPVHPEMKKILKQINLNKKTIFTKIKNIKKSKMLSLVLEKGIEFQYKNTLIANLIQNNANKNKNTFKLNVLLKNIKTQKSDLKKIKHKIKNNKNQLKKYQDYKFLIQQEQDKIKELNNKISNLPLIYQKTSVLKFVNLKNKNLIRKKIFILLISFLISLFLTYILYLYFKNNENYIKYLEKKLPDSNITILPEIKIENLPDYNEIIDDRFSDIINYYKNNHLKKTNYFILSNNSDKTNYFILSMLKKISNESKVLFIDLTFKYKVLKKLFNLDIKNGLTDIFVRNINVEECIVNISKELYVLNSGNIYNIKYDNILKIEKFNQLLNDLKKEYDYIFFYCPNINFLSKNYFNLLKNQDSYSFIIDEKKSNKSRIKKIIELNNENLSKPEMVFIVK